MVTIREALNNINNYNNLNKKRDFNWVGDNIDGKGIYLDNSRYSREDLMGKHVVYMFMVDDKLYIGITNNIVRRLHEHLTRRDSKLYRFIGNENCIYATICKVFNTASEAEEYESGMIGALRYYPKYKLINQK